MLGISGPDRNGRHQIKTGSGELSPISERRTIEQLNVTTQDLHLLKHITPIGRKFVKSAAVCTLHV